VNIVDTLATVASRTPSSVAPVPPLTSSNYIKKSRRHWGPLDRRVGRLWLLNVEIFADFSGHQFFNFGMSRDSR